MIIDQLEKEEVELLNKLTSEFKLDAELTRQAENIIKLIAEEYSNENHVLSFDRFNELEEKVYEYSIQIERSIMDNRCFVVLNTEIADKFNDVNINSFDLWQNIYP